ncbi:MAG: hypothetical protein K2I80_06155 [Ruminococcus sp.]|nr:hypothetical protein [Ruminococcus sp.]
MDSINTAICNECGSKFLKSSSEMKGLCPRCAYVLYGYQDCRHIFRDGKCIYCHWNGSGSEYIKSCLKEKI